MPSRPQRRDGKAPLPAPEERRRLRRTWQLTEEQVAQAFGVTTATVRSWETGRTSPTGVRRAAYTAFLAGLAHGLVPPPPDAARSSVRAPKRRPASGPSPVVALSPVNRHEGQGRNTGAVTRTRPAPTTVGLPVGPASDPVSPARLRRFRLLTLAVGVWICVGYLLATMPVGHV
ncbi:helix-turn-helix domain-containing protein [Streptomyces sp. VRA16 Mangrove soil]|nr:helix-turn-helix domain-containing protein [Streptomyces sp. VRA16 Mangrove soil]